MVGLEGHPAAGDVLGGEADWWQGVSELNRRRYQGLERRRRRGTLGGGRWDVFRSRRVGRRGGLIAATVVLAAAAAELPRNEAQLLFLVETHLQGGEVHRQTPSDFHSGKKKKHRSSIVADRCAITERKQPNKTKAELKKKQKTLKHAQALKHDSHSNPSIYGTQ